MTDELLEEVERLHRLYERTPRRRFLLRWRRLNRWLAACAELQAREQQAARVRREGRAGA